MHNPVPSTPVSPEKVISSPKLLLDVCSLTSLSLTTSPAKLPSLQSYPVHSGPSYPKGKSGHRQAILQDILVVPHFGDQHTCPLPSATSVMLTSHHFSRFCPSLERTQSVALTSHGTRCRSHGHFTNPIFSTRSVQNSDFMFFHVAIFPSSSRAL